MSLKRCPHFTITVQTINSVKTLHSQDLLQPLRVPVYGCAATELMRKRLQAAVEGIDVIRALCGSITDIEDRVVLGPDLQSLSPACCTEERCHQRCEAGFVEIMSIYDQDSTLPPLTTLAASGNRHG